MTPVQEMWVAVKVFAARGDLDAADLLPYRHDKLTIGMVERVSAMLYGHHTHLAVVEDACCRGIEATETLRRELTSGH